MFHSTSFWRRRTIGVAVASRGGSRARQGVRQWRRSGRAEIRLRLKPGDEIRVWEDRPGKRSKAARHRSPRDRCEFCTKIPSSSCSTSRRDCSRCHSSAEAKRRRSSIKSKITCARMASASRWSCTGSIATRPVSCCLRRTARTQAALKQQFRERTPERVYLAVVYGCPNPASGTWRDHLVWDEQALIQKETHPTDPRAAEAISQYQSDRDVRVDLARRGPPDDRETEPDSHPGAAARPHAGRRSEVSFTVRITCARSRSSARRFMPGVSAFITRSNGSSCRSRRPFLTISRSCSLLRARPTDD